MIDWNSETWGNQVHVSETGSWVPDRHDQIGGVDGTVKA